MPARLANEKKSALGALSARVKKLKTRPLLYLTTSILILGGGIYLLHRFQIRRMAPALLDRAGQAEQAQNFAKAAEYLRPYLKYQPRDIDALARLGLALSQLDSSIRDKAEAQSVLERVLRKEPGRREVRRRLVDLLMAQAQADEAKAHLDILLKEPLPHEAELEKLMRRAELEELMGRCEEAGGDVKAADQKYTAAIRHAPTRVETYPLLAELCRQRIGDPKRADQLIEQMVAKNPKSFEAYLARAGYRRKWGQDQVENDLAMARKLAPDHPNVLLASAVVARRRQGDQQKEFEKARSYLERGLALYPQLPNMYEAMAALHLRFGQPDKALACLRSGLNTLPDFPGRNALRWDLADILIETDKTEEARAEMASLLAEGHPSVLVDYLEARIQVKHKAWLQASAILERILPLPWQSSELGSQANLLLGQCYEQLGKPDLQLEAYQRALALDRSNLRAQERAAATLLVLGRTEESLQAHRRLAATSPQAYLVVARLLLLRNLRLAPELRNWGEVTDCVDQAAAAMPQTPEVPILRAEVLWAQGKRAEARDLLDQARLQQPKELEFWLALSQCEASAGREAAANALMDEAQKKLGDHASLRLARLRAIARSAAPAPQKRQAVAKLGENLDKFSDTEQVRLLFALAEACQSLEDRAGAEKFWNQLATHEPHNLGVRLALFNLALEGGNVSGIERMVADLRRLEGEEGVLWRYGEAARLFILAKKGDRSGLESARWRLEEAVSRRPGWFYAPLLEAQIYDFEGKQDFALIDYRRAVSLGARQPAVVRRLVQLLYERQRYVDADEIIQQLQKDASLPADLERLTVEVSLQNQNAERAVAAARSAVAHDPADYRNHLWLGLSLWESGRDSDAAEKELRNAVKASDDAPETWVVLISFLAKSNKQDKLKEALQHAQDRLVTGNGRLALAQCYELAGNHDRAKDLYQAVLADNPGNPLVLRNVASFYLRTSESARAAPLLRKLLDHPDRVSDADVSWARRNLAVALGAEGGYEKFQAALALLEQNSKPQATSADDLRAKAALLASRPERRSEALRLLDQLGSQATAADRFLQARLYEAAGDWRAAGQKLLALLASDSANPSYLFHYAQTLLARRDLEELRRCVARLQELQPTAYATMEMKARLLHLQNQDAEAVALLKNFVQKQDDVEILSLAGKLLEELGEARAADEMYRDYAARSKVPEKILTLAGHLARTNRTGEALDLYEKSWKICRPEDVARDGVIALFQAADPQPHAERVANWLEAAVRANPAADSLLFDLANVRSLQGHYQQAEALYRRILERNPRDAMAANNLAYLLAAQGAKTAEALKLIERAIDVAGPAPGRQDTLALVNMSLGRSDLAINALEKAIAVGATPGRYFHLARAYLLNNDRKAAAAALREAHKLGLTAKSVHPLERAAYAETLEKLKQ